MTSRGRVTEIDIVADPGQHRRRGRAADGRAAANLGGAPRQLTERDDDDVRLRARAGSDHARPGHERRSGPAASPPLTSR